MTPEYRAEKEASVTNIGGGGMWEINFVTIIAPAAAFLWAILQTRQSFFKPYTLPAGVSDFLLHCCGILFATTIYSSAPQVLTGLLFLPALAVVLQPSVELKSDSKPVVKSDKIEKSDKVHEDSSSTEPDPFPIKPFITTYRGAMMIITCASILAVDFPVFPRRFAKTESFGTSLMDLGVGSFVFAAGLAAARQPLKEQHAGAPSFVSRLFRALRTSAPLVLLGLARLYAVKQLDYVEHVSEYGVHWNFFFTLAVLPPATAILQPILGFIPSLGAVAFVIACIYEMILYFTPGLKVYIILSAREEGDWLSQNREGIFSLIGYLAIFIAGMGTGRNIMPRDPEPDDPFKRAKDPLDEDDEWLASVLGQSPDDETPAKPPPEIPQLKPELPKTALVHLAKWTVIWFVICLWAMWDYGPHLFVSRRMANLAYCVWVCCFNTAQLLLFCGIETLMFPNIYKAKERRVERQRISDATSRVMKAFNRNGLALFLLANLLTGAINLTVPTLHMGDVESMAILVAYMGTLCGVALALDAWDLSIKL